MPVPWSTYVPYCTCAELRWCSCWSLDPCWAWDRGGWNMEAARLMDWRATSRFGLSPPLCSESAATLDRGGGVRAEADRRNICSQLQLA